MKQKEEHVDHHHHSCSSSISINILIEIIGHSLILSFVDWLSKSFLGPFKFNIPIVNVHNNIYQVDAPTLLLIMSIYLSIVCTFIFRSINFWND